MKSILAIRNDGQVCEDCYALAQISESEARHKKTLAKIQRRLISLSYLIEGLERSEKLHPDVEHDLRGLIAEIVRIINPTEAEKLGNRSV